MAGSVHEYVDGLHSVLRILVSVADNDTSFA